MIKFVKGAMIMLVAEGTATKPIAKRGLWSPSEEISCFKTGTCVLFSSY